MKKKIGIIPASFIGNPDESCMQDYYKFGNNYAKRISESGCIPIGLIPVDNRISKEQLELCDGFLVQGGAEFFPYHFQVIDYAVKHGKRYLGICIGQQLIYVYFKVKSIVEEQGSTTDTVEAICQYLSEQPKGFTLQKRIPNHRNEYPKRGNEDAAKHDVDVVPGTLLHKVLGKDKIRLCSFHYLSTPADQTLVPVNAWSADGVVEGTEYSDNILGVQGHPEAD